MADATLRIEDKHGKPADRRNVSMTSDVHGIRSTSNLLPGDRVYIGDVLIHTEDEGSSRRIAERIASQVA